MKNIQTIVFDLYHTLVEITAPTQFFLTLFRSSADGFGMEVRDYLDLIMKKDLQALFQILPADFADLFHTHQAKLTQEIESVALYAETIQVLDCLAKNYRIILMSNLASPYKQPVFRHNLDPYFEQMIFSSDLGYRKPETEIFKTVEIITGNSPEEILMVGDSLTSDIEGAQKMGWHFLRVQRMGKLAANYEIRDLTEISGRLN